MLDNPLAFIIFIDSMFAVLFGGIGVVTLRVYSGPANGPLIRGLRSRLSPREQAIMNVAAAHVMVLFSIESLAQATIGFITDYLNLPFVNIITQILWSITLVLVLVVPMIFIIQTVVIFVRLRHNPDYYLAPTIESSSNHEDASSNK